jgi:pSer/pThr/pTyr-binding forkhead associated (FHA) protein
MADLILEIIEGPEAGRVIPLTGSAELGSSPSAAIQLVDPHVSAQHARITAAGEGAILEDLGDPGGTFVDDSEVAAPTRISPGAEIQLGVTVLKLRTVTEAATEPSAVRPPPPPLLAAGRAPGYIPAETLSQEPIDEVEELLDVHTKAKARVAPLALFVLVVFVVLVFLATDRF